MNRAPTLIHDQLLTNKLFIHPIDYYHLIDKRWYTSVEAPLAGARLATRHQVISDRCNIDAFSHDLSWREIKLQIGGPDGRKYYSYS